MSQTFNAASLARENVKVMTPYMSARRLGGMEMYGSMPTNTQQRQITNLLSVILTVTQKHNLLA